MHGYTIPTVLPATEGGPYRRARRWTWQISEWPVSAVVEPSASSVHSQKTRCWWQEQATNVRGARQSRPTVRHWYPTTKASEWPITRHTSVWNLWTSFLPATTGGNSDKTSTGFLNAKITQHADLHWLGKRQRQFHLNVQPRIKKETDKWPSNTTIFI